MKLMASLALLFCMNAFAAGPRTLRCRNEVSGVGGMALTETSSEFTVPVGGAKPMAETWLKTTVNGRPLSVFVSVVATSGGDLLAGVEFWSDSSSKKRSTSYSYVKWPNEAA